MPYAAHLTAAALQRLRDRRQTMQTDRPPAPGADDDLTPNLRRALAALDAATDQAGTTWASVNQARWCHGIVWPDLPRLTYAKMRGRLWRLARDGYLIASPAGQPPGLSGLLFRLTPRGHAALIDARAAQRVPTGDT